MRNFAPRLAIILSGMAGTCAWAATADPDRIPESAVRAHMEFLASDAMNGRGSGTRDEWITATYIAAQMRRQGLQPPGDDGDFVIALAMRGVVAQTVSSFGLRADYHQPSDENSRTDFRHMTESIQSMLEPIRWLADSGFQPEGLPGGRPQ